ncbi:MAG: hypothetical protein PQJ58_20050 [Spirochaetales bacterium]|nr:hypothetical protein [Spirochaetales bacterium]
MRKIISVLLIFMTVTGLAFAKDRYYSPAFSWVSPEVKGQGGSFISNGSGYNSLFVNPASFEKYREKEKKDGEIKKKAELTAISLGAGYSGDLFTYLEENRAGEKEMLELILDQVTSNGMGASFQVGTGYVGRRIGIGFMTVAEMDAPAVETTLGVTGDLMLTSGLVAGYAHPFELGQFKLVVGADIRPMYRFIAKDIDIGALTGSATDAATSGDESGDISFSEVNAMAGLGLGFDAGVDFYWRDLIASVTMRDIGNTRYFFKPVEQAFGMTFANEEIDEIYVTPWTMNFGVAYSPTLGKLNKFIAPTVHGSFSQPLVREDALYDYKSQSFWSRLDLGTEVVLLSAVALRAGLQGGYFTAGFGLDLFFLELNGALYADELGSHAGDQPEMGGSLEFAIRF